MSVVDICNAALTMVGARGKITSLNEDSSSAKACKIHYDMTRYEVQMAASWPFTRRYTVLGLIGAAAGTAENPLGDGIIPEGDWTYCYAYPSDCLKPIWIKPSSTGEIATPFINLGNVRDAQNNLIYYAEGTRVDLDTGNLQKVLYTNKAAAQLVYVADVTEPHLFPTDFKETLIKALASKICMNVSADKQLLQGLTMEYKQFLSRYIQLYGSEHEKDKRPVILDPVPTLMDARSPSSSYTW